MRWLTIFLIAAVFIAAIAVFKNLENIAGHDSKNDIPCEAKSDRHAAIVRLAKYAAETKTYAIKNAYSSRYCFLVDMKMPSWTRRFFIVDLKYDSIIQAGLVTHGSGINNFNDSIVFSNEPGSNCTSLGKYKIGKSYSGKFGLAFKLYGLDKTNSNAFNRFVVLHAHPCVPDEETAPVEICRSWGCPTISPMFLNTIKMYHDKSMSPILLWIFN